MGPTFWIGLVVAAIVVGGGTYLFMRSRGPKADPVLHFNCPKCKQRLKYKAKRAGHPGECPRCHHRLNFPTATDD